MMALGFRKGTYLAMQRMNGEGGGRGWGFPEDTGGVKVVTLGSGK